MLRAQAKAKTYVDQTRFIKKNWRGGHGVFQNDSQGKVIKIRKVK